VDGALTIVVRRLDGKVQTVIPVDGYTPDWIKWKNNHRLIGAIHRTARGRSLRVLDNETRIAAVDPDGSHNVDIGRGLERRFVMVGHRQLESEVVDMLPDDPNHILLALAGHGGLNVEKVDVDSGSGDIVEYGKDKIGRWITDRTGRARVGGGIYQTTQFTYVRDAGGGDFREIEGVDANFATPLWPISFSPDPNLFYAKAVSSTGTWGLVEYNIAKGGFGRTIASLPDRDTETVVRDKQLVAYIAAGDRPGVEKAVYLDPVWEHDIESINHALPDTLNLIVDRSADGKRLLVFAEGRQEPGAYYILDRNGAKPTMDVLGERYPDIDPAQVVAPRPITYSTRDGVTVHGFVILPKNAGSGPVPFVVLPHGGPTARDTGYFDYLAQFLVSRGYGVFQPNGRGSTGYGAKFQQAGLQQWGLRMQDDITDGTKWLVDQKLADSAKICIMGGGYGGYAALMGAATAPELYRCVISLDGITDLPAYADTHHYFGARFAFFARFDNGKMSETSPVNLADKINASVLLVHGGQDWANPVEESRSMESALKHAGKSVEAIYFPDDEGRFVQDNDDGTGEYATNSNLVSIEANRIAFLKATEAFLKKTIGP
jgi:dienelactone hydrolase